MMIVSATNADILNNKTIIYSLNLKNMSVRAYKIIKIQTAKANTFNCWQDDYIFSLAITDNYNDGGILSFERQTITNALKEKKLDKSDKEKLKHILKDMGKKEYGEYYCF